MDKHRKGEPISMVTAYDYPSAVHVSLALMCVLLLRAHISLAAIQQLCTGEVLVRRQQMHRQSDSQRGQARGSNPKSTSEGTCMRQ